LNGTLPISVDFGSVKEKLKLLYPVGLFNHYQNLEIYFVDHSGDIRNSVVDGVVFLGPLTFVSPALNCGGSPSNSEFIHSIFQTSNWISAIYPSWVKLLV
jgi:hypothetical protein